MFIRDVVLYGEFSRKANALKETGIFERILDVYMVSGLIGLLTNKYEDVERDTVNVKIFIQQLNGEWDRLRYFASLVTLANKNDQLNDQSKQKQIINEAFGDWFTNESDSENEKYQMFYKHSLAGINLLYDRVIGTSTDNDSYYRNFYKFIKSIDKIDVETTMDRLIIANLI
ncbi:hypothetical protein [Clostridium chromiireducens]|uniref:Uncharacterized protein n=1 Tax=Clostridium chromiireducens TaxID=225345 RepID=A0A1V4I887_9CLOT|nr:hypothetical protein [Clostridium chromiireducens]OPJ56114.1 hypothetical protein CLCHR_45940 [Clostridium chromiireducens]